MGNKSEKLLPFPLIKYSIKYVQTNSDGFIKIVDFMTPGGEVLMIIVYMHYSIYALSSTLSILSTLIVIV